MDLYEAIEKRRSIRSFLDRPVEEEKLRRVLNAGRLSPSANNRQARKFVVVRDGARRAAVAKAADQPWLAQAPVLLAVVGTTPEAVMHCGIPTDPVDCAIAIDHMTLAAVAEGLGTCWIGHFDQDACRQILGVPDNARIIELMPLGYPATTAAPRPRKELDDIVCDETFS